ncbi:hypothetical protein Tco_1171386, partial [Tanacetum coccineum]
KEHLRRFHGMDDAKEIWEAIRTRFGGNANSKKVQKAVLKQQFKRDSFYQDQGAGKKEQKQNCLLTMDDGANEIYEKDEKLKKYRRIGMKAVKEKEQLQKTLDSWKDSSKNLWRLINSGMSSNSKIGLGRFIKTNDFKGVPHPLSGDYTPKPQEEIDESLYVYGKSSEYSTCQSNDSAGSIGTSSEHTVDLESGILRVPSEVYVSTPMKTTKKGMSAPKSKEVEP